MRVSIAALLGACLPVALLAQAPAPRQAPVAPAEDSPSPIAAEEARATVEDLARTLEENYVFPDIARKYAATLRAKAATGGYDGLGSAGAFADRVTADLRAVSPDNHLRLHLARSDATMGPARRPAGADGPRRPEAIEDARWLAPGIAYVRFNVFPPDSEVTKAAEAFMTDHADAKR